jgi:hypothetical protein
MPYAVPRVVAGVRREASIALIADWIGRNPQEAWAAAYVPGLVESG